MRINEYKIIGNCPLCGQKALHVMGEGEAQTQQCISCGYVSSERYKLGEGQTKNDNDLYNELTAEMKEWSIEKNNRIWIPTIITLPVGMLYPSNSDENVMVWKFAPMVDITEDEKEKYPIPNQEGEYYKQRYDTDEGVKTFEWFAESLHHVNTLMKNSIENTKGNLPDLETL